MAEKGRPRLEVDLTQVEHLLSLNFTWEQISNCIGVSVSTVQRRAREFGIRKSYTPISDNDLEEKVKGYLHNSPAAGEVMIKGHLESIGIHVQRARIREAIYSIRGTA